MPAFFPEENFGISNRTEGFLGKILWHSPQSCYLWVAPRGRMKEGGERLLSPALGHLGSQMTECAPYPVLHTEFGYLRRRRKLGRSWPIAHMRHGINHWLFLLCVCVYINSCVTISTFVYERKWGRIVVRKRKKLIGSSSSRHL